MDRGAWWAPVYGVAESDRTENVHNTMNVPLYGWTTFCSSSVDEHLGCSHLLAIVNNHECIGEPAFSSFVYIPRGEVTGSCTNSMFNSLRNCQTFPQQLHHFTFPPAVPNFPTSSATLVIF